MNRKEAIEALKGFRKNDFEYPRDWEFLNSLIGVLGQPITLADFLGWEEGVEYKCYDDNFIIRDNRLYIWSYAERDWIDAAYSVSINGFEQLRRVKKAEKKSRKDELLDELNELISSERINEIIEELRVVE